MHEDMLSAVLFPMNDTVMELFKSLGEYVSAKTKLAMLCSSAH